MGSPLPESAMLGQKASKSPEVIRIRSRIDQLHEKLRTVEAALSNHADVLTGTVPQSVEAAPIVDVNSIEQGVELCHSTMERIYQTLNRL